MWKFYTKVTQLKEQYYRVRNMEPEVINAYVTFRDIQSRNKAIGRKDVKIEGKAVRIESSVDPETILWENLGMPKGKRIRRIGLTIGLTALVMGISFFGIWSISLFEKMRFEWVQSECNDDTYDIETALEDYSKTKRYQKLGLMNCYCQNMH